MNEPRRAVVMHPRTEAARRVRPTSRSIAELQERTEVGEVLVDGLRRAQLALSLRWAAVVALVIGGAPAAFSVFPELGRLEIAGIRMPWLLLGVAAFPFLLGVAWSYRRAAERIDAEFAEMAERL